MLCFISLYSDRLAYVNPSPRSASKNEALRGLIASERLALFKTKMETKSTRHVESKNVGPSVDSVGQPKELSSSEKYKGGVYRDRAAERRSLHGGFGVGPGQKKSADDIDSSSPVFDNPEDAAAEALNMSFGVGSYARRMLENMGWKEGEALGSSMKGLTEPLQAVGNKGSSGLGWNHNRNWKHA